VSSDGGGEWKFLTGDFKFKQLFVHPDTGALFAVAEYYRPPDNTSGGSGETLEADKVVTSVDGINWRDITGRSRDFGRVIQISADPGHAGRICLSLFGAIRVYALCAADDSHDGWEAVNPFR
jgi:hypothetical protein